MDAPTARLLGPYLRESLYREALRRGLAQQGQEVALDVQRACELFGVVQRGIRPTLSESMRMTGLLQWILDTHDPRWLARSETRAGSRLIFLKPNDTDRPATKPPGSVSA